jgi:hypothetical protein
VSNLRRGRLRAPQLDDSSPSRGTEVAPESLARRCLGRVSLRPIATTQPCSGALTEKLRAIENAYSVNGVHRVASEIQSVEN